MENTIRKVAKFALPAVIITFILLMVILFIGNEGLSNLFFLVGIVFIIFLAVFFCSYIYMFILMIRLNYNDKNLKKEIQSQITFFVVMLVTLEIFTILSSGFTIMLLGNLFTIITLFLAYTTSSYIYKK